MKLTMISPYYVNTWEALGLGYIIAYCKKHYKGELEINFFQGKFDSDEEIIEVAQYSDIVAFSCTSPAYSHGLHLARALKNRRPNIHTVFGCWHTASLPMDVLKEECVDQVIIGEGEHAMLRILNGERINILQGDKLPPEELPWPDREAIKNERTIDLCQEMNGKRTASFQMNRGCKVHCKFCAEQGMTGKYNRVTNPIRSRTNEDVLNEIEYVESRYGINMFKFVDASMDISPEQVIQFCKDKVSRGNNLKWEANIHATFVQDERVFEWLGRAKCFQINIGVESGSPKILKQIGKGTNLRILENIFNWAKKYNIERRGFFLLGMPDETDEDIALTEQFIDKVHPDIVGFTILCPYPGSDFYDHKIHKDVDWSATDEYGNDFWFTKYHSNSELKQIQKRLTDKYYLLLCPRQKEKE